LSDDDQGKLKLLVQSNLLSFNPNDWIFKTSGDQSVNIDFPMVNTNDVVFSLDMSNLKQNQRAELSLKLETITTSSEYQIEVCANFTLDPS